MLCHSHHAIRPPTDAMLGTGKESVCLQCHEDPSDAGFVAARQWEAAFRDAEAKFHAASETLERARRAGMEVSDPLYRLTEAREQLTEARVLVHAFEATGVLRKIAAGAAIAVDARGEGETALSETDFRRRGLYASLVGIALLAAGLWFKIRELDRRLPAG